MVRSLRLGAVVVVVGGGGVVVDALCVVFIHVFNTVGLGAEGRWMEIFFLEKTKWLKRG